MALNRRKIVIYSKLSEQYPWVLNVIRRHGLIPTMVGHGEEAYEKVRTLFPGFVLLDVSMPKLNGLECAKQIKASFPDIRVILVSALDSLSIQEAAKKDVDLFVTGDTAREEVSGFIEATQQWEEVQPQSMNDLEREMLSKRDTTRYPVAGEIQYRIGEQWFSGALVNVSQEGLLFQSQKTIPIGETLFLSWTDQGLQHVEVFAIVVRQTPSKHFQYSDLIGVQFLQSSEILNQRITELSNKNETFPENTEIELDLETLEDLLSHGVEYFRFVFQGGKAPLSMELSMVDIVEHERKAFQTQDEYSECVQELVTSRILCHLLKNIVEQVKDSKTIKHFTAPIIQITYKLMEKIDQVEKKSDQLILKTLLPLERHRINESSNGLYQRKSSLLRLVIQKIKVTDVNIDQRARYESLLGRNKKLASFQQDLSQIAKQEKELMKSPIRKKEETASRKMVLQINEPKKNPVFLYLAILSLFAVFLPWVQLQMETKFAKEEIRLNVKPESIRVLPHKSLQINLSSESWQRLNERGKEFLLNQIEIYLTHQKLSQCKVMDGEQLLAAIYADVIDDDHRTYHYEIFKE